MIKKIKKILKSRNLWLFFWYYIAAKLHYIKYKSKDIVLLRLDLIGDCTMFSSTAKAICDTYPDKKVTLVCLSISKPVFERLECFDRIITVDFKPGDIDYRKLKKLIKELRYDKYDLLLQPQTSKLPIADILAAAIRCNRRIAIETKVGNSSAEWVRIVNRLYDEFIPIPEGTVSEFDYYGAFARGLGLKDYQTTCPHIPYADQHYIEGDYYVMYPAGSFKQKFWPAERFAKIADDIYQKTGLLAVILGADYENWVAEQICSEMHLLTAMSTINLMGRTSISDVIDIIGNAKFVISNDTSGVHIACATQTPSIAIVGGWHFKRFLPYHIERVEPTDCLPLAAFTEMPCYHCDWQWDTIGVRNPECLELMKQEQPSECIGAIEYTKVRRLVDQVLEECKLYR